MQLRSNAETLQRQQRQGVVTQTGSIEVSPAGGASIRQVVAITGCVRRCNSGGLRLPDKRNPVITQSAKDLGNGGSAFHPGSDSTAVWVFNNRTGVITGVCQIPVDQAVSRLTASDVESCRNNTIGYLVSGTIRFSLSDSPDATSAQSTALPQPLNARLNLRPSQLKNRRNGVLKLAPGSDYPVVAESCVLQ